MSDNKLLDLSIEFAISAVNLADNIKTPKSSYLIDQFARAGTSVGANIHEAQYAQGTKDFISKLEISLKEAYETEYWLELLFETGYMDEQTYKPIQNSCGAIRRMLISSLKTIKGNEKCSDHETSIL